MDVITMCNLRIHWQVSPSTYFLGCLLVDPQSASSALRLSLCFVLFTLHRCRCISMWLDSGSRCKTNDDMLAARTNDEIAYFT